MYLEIITPESKIFQGEVKRVKLPGSVSSFEILRNHAPIVSTLEKGIIRVIDEHNKKHTFRVNGGIIENKDNKIIVLLESI